MTKPYWVSYKPAEHIADTQGLTRLAKACYFDLFNACFVRGGFLPNDAAELARICGCTPDEWAAACCELLRLFAIDGRGFYHRKLLAEMQRYDALIEKWKKCLPRPYDKEFIDNRDIVRASNNACVYCGNASGAMLVEEWRN